MDKQDKSNGTLFSIDIYFLLFLYIFIKKEKRKVNLVKNSKIVDIFMSNINLGFQSFYSSLKFLLVSDSYFSSGI